MRILRSSLKSRIGLLVLALIVTGAALSSAPGNAADILCCGHAQLVTYYNNAAHTTVVGRCSFPCNDDPVCTGTQTQYSTTKQLTCCIC